MLSMHSPWEVSSKADVYEAYRGYCAFLKDYEIRYKKGDVRVGHLPFVSGTKETCVPDRVA